MFEAIRMEKLPLTELHPAEAGAASKECIRKISDRFNIQAGYTATEANKRVVAIAVLAWLTHE